MKIEVDLTRNEKRDQTNMLLIDGVAPENCHAIEIDLKDVSENRVGVVSDQRIKSLRVEGQIFSLGKGYPEPVVLELRDLDGDDQEVRMNGEPMGEGAWLKSIRMRLTGMDNEMHVEFMKRASGDQKTYYGSCVILVDKVTVDAEE